MALPTVLTWLLASFATAALSHALIGFLGVAGSGGSYDEHDHGALAPIALSALSLAAVLLIGSALRRVTGRTACDPVTVLAHRFRSMHPLVPSLAVAAGGFTTLVAMEFAEQFAAFGHVQGIGDALGGNPVAGVTVIVVAAALIALAGLRFARALVASAAAVAVALAAWIVAVPRQGPDGAASVRRVLRRRHASAPAFLARCSGLRAPPSAPV